MQKEISKIVDFYEKDQITESKLKLNEISNLPDLLNDAKIDIYLRGNLKQFLTEIIVEPSNTVQIIHDLIDDYIDDKPGMYCFKNYNYLGI